MNGNRYIEEQYRNKVRSSVFGIILSLGINLVVLLLLSFKGFTYIYPPPEEKTMVIDFEEIEAPEIKIQKKGREPAAENADPTKNLELVQKSEGPFKGEKQNLAKEATVGKDGDVEVPDNREEEIDNRALFPAAKNSAKDTLAPQTAKEPSGEIKSGHASGNTAQGKIVGSPTARIKGRSSVGVPPNPDYNIQNEGIVVVQIWVDRQGAVVKATAGAEGTTVTDKTLWNAARQAAFKARFNVDNECPELVEGTITYVFKLK